VRIVLLVVAGGADPVDSATPLHAAGTPTLDRVARDGHLARVALGAASCWDGFTRLLGATTDRPAPLGPAEVASAGLAPSELEGARWAARLDLVTTDDERVLDPFGGRIGDPEAGALFEDTAGALPHGRLVRLPGRRGLWLGTAPIPDAPPPWEVGDRPPRVVLADAPELLALYEASRRALTAHDVNAVRVDLGENPANALWPHGAGELPLAMEPPSWSVGRRVALVAGGGPAMGLAGALGWTPVSVDAASGADGLDALCAAALAALADHDVVVVRTRHVATAGLRSGPAAADEVHAARVDAHSAVDARLAAPLLGALEERGPFVLAAVADGVLDGTSRTYTAEPVPCGVLRSGGQGHGLAAFHEKACSDGGARLGDAQGFADLLEHEIAALA
jgi:2,3-bisphosphoglycerate-independent phosphoglycerate mutase